MACRAAAGGISFSADFRRVFQGLDSLNFSLRDLVLMNRDLVSPLSSWLLKFEEEKQNMKIKFLDFIFTETNASHKCTKHFLEIGTLWSEI
jgi:hypothetical protein